MFKQFQWLPSHKQNQFKSLLCTMPQFNQFQLSLSPMYNQPQYLLTAIKLWRRSPQSQKNKLPPIDKAIVWLTLQFTINFLLPIIPDHFPQFNDFTHPQCTKCQLTYHKVTRVITKPNQYPPTWFPKQQVTLTVFFQSSALTLEFPEHKVVSVAPEVKEAKSSYYGVGSTKFTPTTGGYTKQQYYYEVQKPAEKVYTESQSVYPSQQQYYFPQAQPVAVQTVPVVAGQVAYTQPQTVYQKPTYSVYQDTQPLVYSVVDANQVAQPKEYKVEKVYPVQSQAVSASSYQQYQQYPQYQLLPVQTYSAPLTAPQVYQTHQTVYSAKPNVLTVKSPKKNSVTHVTIEEVPVTQTYSQVPQYASSTSTSSVHTTEETVEATPKLTESKVEYSSGQSTGQYQQTSARLVRPAVKGGNYQQKFEQVRLTGEETEPLQLN